MKEIIHVNEPEPEVHIHFYEKMHVVALLWLFFLYIIISYKNTPTTCDAFTC